MSKSNPSAKAPKGTTAAISERIFVGTENHKIEVGLVEVYCPELIQDKDFHLIRTQVRKISIDISNKITQKMFPEAILND